MQKLKVGDTVQVMAGAERTQKSNRGKILSFDFEKNRVRVVSFTPGATRPQQYFIELTYPVSIKGRYHDIGRFLAAVALEGGILESAGTIALASVSLVCPKCNKPTRVGVKIDKDKKKRVCKQCDATID